MRKERKRNERQSGEKQERRNANERKVWLSTRIVFFCGVTCCWGHFLPSAYRRNRHRRHRRLKAEEKQEFRLERKNAAAARALLRERKEEREENYQASRCER